MNSYHPKWSDISEVVQLLEECSVEPHGSHDRRLCCQIGSNWRTKSAGAAVPNIRTTLEQPGESPLLSNEAHAKYWGGPPLGVQILYLSNPKTGIKQIEQFNDIILRILRSRLESQSWNSFNSFNSFPL